MVAAILFSMLVYIFILFYGTQVMRGVMEEKNNRIIEVVISSVKPVITSYSIHYTKLYDLAYKPFR